MVNFNKEWALKVGKAKFKKNHEAMADKIDLDAEWEKLQVKKEVVKDEIKK